MKHRRGTGMKTKFLISAILLASLTCTQSAFAAQSSDRIHLNGSLDAVVEVVAVGTALNANISRPSGTLDTFFMPAFEMRSTQSGKKNLTLKVSSKIQGGTYVNSAFDNGSLKYIILTNDANPPPLSSLSTIKAGDYSNNPNAIAWQANDPSDDTGNIDVGYDPGNDWWTLRLRSSGYSKTSFLIPAAAALPGTLGYDDEDGAYKATITVSFL